MKTYNGFTHNQRITGDKIVKKAIKNGILPPLHETKCNICGQDKGIREYHCEDYSPENVVNDATPLCFRCHRHIHANNKNTKNWLKYEKEVVQGNKKGKPVYMKYWSKEWEQKVTGETENNTTLDQYFS